MPAPKRVVLEETEEELMSMHRAEVTYGLNDKQIEFCEYFCRNYNLKSAAIKAGYSAHSAHSVAYRIRKMHKANRYIAWLRLRMTNKSIVRAADIIDKYSRIAFSDITDYCTIKNGRMMIKDDDCIDGQLVKSIKRSKDGVSIEMYDKMQALRRLEDFFKIMPKDWKEKIEERKLEIMEERLKIDKIKIGYDSDIEEDDGFLMALRDSAEEVWE